MALEFPNRTRVVNSSARSIAFSGHDGVMEIRFSVPFPAIDNLYGSKLDTPEAYLAAFDSMRALIQNVATNTYAGGRRSFNVLEASKF